MPEGVIFGQQHADSIPQGSHCKGVVEDYRTAKGSAALGGGPA